MSRPQLRAYELLERPDELDWKSHPYRVHLHYLRRDNATICRFLVYRKEQLCPENYVLVRQQSQSIIRPGTFEHTAAVQLEHGRGSADDNAPSPPSLAVIEPTSALDTPDLASPLPGQPAQSGASG